ncbi:MAG: choice-of-anchor I family protein [Terrimicrobiaceae bacterium]
MKKTLLIALFCAAAGALAPSARAQFTLLSNISANQGNGTSAGEIVAFDSVTDRLFVTSSGSGVHQINVFNMADPSNISANSTINFSTTFGGNSTNMLGLSSVAVNSAKGFGVASLIPTANTTTLGKVGFFNLSTGASIGTLDVGYHPDSVTFSPDGTKLVVVNEGEFNASSGTNAPGSISIINVSAITNSNIGNATQTTLDGLGKVTTDFTAGNLSGNASLSGIRNSNIAAVGTSGNFTNTVPDFTNVANQDPNAIEPEYASVVGDKVYVSLQDNNAMGEYDLTTDKWTKITNLGTITQTIDANDTGSPTISITQSVKGLPMPDTVATYTSAGKTYIVTANEGDARVDDRDKSRFGDVSGGDSMNGIVDTDAPSNFLNTGNNTNNGLRSDAQLGRLEVSRLDGDTDGDGKIDAPTMMGTRSFSIWEVTESGLALAYDSGSGFEQKIAEVGGFVNNRSDEKGPEPEGVVLGEINGSMYAFIGMERTNHIFMYDISDPTNAVFAGVTRISSGNIPARPEGMTFVSASDSPNGQNLLIVGFEGDGTASTERIAVYSVIPEPSTYALFALAALGLGWHLRRKIRLQS